MIKYPAMTVPLDRFYHFVEKIACEIYGAAVVVMRFWPHGSKNIENLSPMPTYWHDWTDTVIHPVVYCNDQEPLTYEFYRQNLRIFDNDWIDLLKSLDFFIGPKNLNYVQNAFQKNILLHSEKRSNEIEKYVADGELIPVYYWSHAVIARDWYRYATHENFEKKIQKRFLIYNRSWTGSREYRLGFADLLIEHDLVDQCQTWFNPMDGDQHYKQHNFARQAWCPEHLLENYFPPSSATSCSSADFCTQDYQSTEIEVVLETLFDDERLHLTEKSLRPIACQQPFILMATHGSLQYLRDYGFQTFDTVWDESYDQIIDPVERMQAIIKVMQEISAWSATQRLENAEHMQSIVDHNHQHFFSEAFFDQIIMELRNNMQNAFDQITADPGFDQWIDRWKIRFENKEIQAFTDKDKHPHTANLEKYNRVLKFIEHYPKTVANKIGK
jgi:hypothetical protein